MPASKAGTVGGDVAPVLAPGRCRVSCPACDCPSRAPMTATSHAAEVEDL